MRTLCNPKHTSLRIRECEQNQERRDEEASERKHEEQVKMASDRMQGERAEIQQAAESDRQALLRTLREAEARQESDRAEARREAEGGGKRVAPSAL